MATAVPVMATVWEKPPGWQGAAEGVTGVACVVEATLRSGHLFSFAHLSALEIFLFTCIFVLSLLCFSPFLQFPSSLYFF